MPQVAFIQGLSAVPAPMSIAQNGNMAARNVRNMTNGIDSFCASIGNGIVKGYHAVKNAIVAAFNWIAHHARNAWNALRSAYAAHPREFQIGGAALAVGAATVGAIWACTNCCSSNNSQQNQNTQSQQTQGQQGQQTQGQQPTAPTNQMSQSGQTTETTQTTTTTTTTNPSNQTAEPTSQQPQFQVPHGWRVAGQTRLGQPVLLPDVRA